MPATLSSLRMVSRNFLGILLAWAISTLWAVWPFGSPARWTRAFSPYFPLLVSMALPARARHSDAGWPRSTGEATAARAEEPGWNGQAGTVKPLWGSRTWRRRAG